MHFDILCFWKDEGAGEFSQPEEFVIPPLIWKQLHVRQSEFSFILTQKFQCVIPKCFLSKLVGD